MRVSGRGRTWRQMVVRYSDPAGRAGGIRTRDLLNPIQGEAQLRCRKLALYCVTSPRKRGGSARRQVEALDHLGGRPSRRSLPAHDEAQRSDPPLPVLRPCQRARPLRTTSSTRWCVLAIGSCVCACLAASRTASSARRASDIRPSQRGVEKCTPGSDTASGRAAARPRGSSRRATRQPGNSCSARRWFGARCSAVSAASQSSPRYFPARGRAAAASMISATSSPSSVSRFSSSSASALTSASVLSGVRKRQKKRGRCAARSLQPTRPTRGLGRLPCTSTSGIFVRE